MKTAIFFDTETTGFPLFKERSTDPGQPHIVQLAAALVNLDDRSIVSSIDLISKPDGWSIPKAASDVHGITNEIAEECGIPEEQLTKLFMAFCKGRDIAAHNTPFDNRIVRIALKRFMSDEVAEQYKEHNFYCTMKSSSKIVQCPPTPKMVKAGRNHFKNPNLGEAYKHFTGDTLEGAHNAMVDVQACIDVYFGIQDYNLNNGAAA